MTPELLAAGLFVFGGFLYYTVDAVVVLYLVKSESGTNSDRKAKIVMLSLVGRANNIILIHDNGGADEGSIYQDQEVVDAVVARLEAVRGLHVKCLFNEDNDTLFRRRLSDHHRVTIRITFRSTVIHFKIIDGGIYGYISRHERGEFHRPYRSFDFSGVPSWYLDFSSKRERAFGRYIRSMEEAFA